MAGPRRAGRSLELLTRPEQARRGEAGVWLMLAGVDGPPGGDDPAERCRPIQCDVEIAGDEARQDGVGEDLDLFGTWWLRNAGDGGKYGRPVVADLVEVRDA